MHIIANYNINKDINQMFIESVDKRNIEEIKKLNFDIDKLINTIKSIED